MGTVVYPHLVPDTAPTVDADALVPTVDLSRPESWPLAAVDAACRDHGFFRLTGHQADQLIDRMWDVTTAFFDQPALTKDPLRRSAENPFGYWDRELTKRRRDAKEVFDYIDPTLATIDHPDRNRWPTTDHWANADIFKETLTDFFEAFAQLATDTLGVIGRALGLANEATMEGLGLVNSRPSSTVRLNHYPVGDPVTTNERAELAPLGDTALGYHTDPGVLTLLLQDQTGGLQAESARHGWIDVPPVAGSVVVNLGDTMQVWTNDRYRAAVHRVVTMTERRRYSIPFFSNPPRDTILAPLPAVLHQSNEAARYRSFTWRDYIGGRMTDNFADYGADDIQIARFRVDPEPPRASSRP